MFAQRLDLKIAGMVILAAALLASGCASGEKGPSVRRLQPEEAAPLMALQEFKKSPGPKAKPTDTDPVRLESHGDAMVRAADWNAAEFQYARALTLAGDSAKGRLRAKLGEVYLKGGKFVQAELVFKQQADKDPQSARAWQGLGLALMGQGRINEAERYLQQALTQDKKAWRSWSGLGIIYNSQQKPEQAVKAFHAALDIQPTAAPLYNNLGLAYMKSGKLEQAENYLTRALSLDPKYKLAHNNLGIVLAHRKKWIQARRAFEHGAGAHQAHNNLGVLYSWQGEYNKAQKEFLRAREVNPRHYKLAQRHLDQVDHLTSGGSSSTLDIRNPKKYYKKPASAAGPASVTGKIAAETGFAPIKPAEKPQAVVSRFPARPVPKAPMAAPVKKPAHQVISQTGPGTAVSVKQPQPDKKARPAAEQKAEKKALKQAKPEARAPKPKPALAALAVSAPMPARTASLPGQKPNLPQVWDPKTHASLPRHKLPGGFIGVVKKTSGEGVVEGIWLDKKGQVKTVVEPHDKAVAAPMKISEPEAEVAALALKPEPAPGDMPARNKEFSAKQSGKAYRVSGKISME